MPATLHDSQAGQAGSHSHESQHLAFSLNKGRSWTRVEGNPVQPNPGAVKVFRDPKLILHEPSLTWVMALAVFDHAEFWASAELVGDGAAVRLLSERVPALGRI